MKMRLRPIIVLVGVLFAASIASPSALPAPSPDEVIVHVLNRLGMTSRDVAAQYELPLLRARREQKQQAGAQTGTRGTGPAMPPAAPAAAPAPFERQQANLPLAE